MHPRKTHIWFWILITAALSLLANPMRAFAEETPMHSFADKTHSLTDETPTSTEKSSVWRYTFVQDGDLSKEIHLPTHEWYTVKDRPDGMILAVHGLSLHGMSFDILARAFAADNALGAYYVVAPDMRGFGRNRTGHDFCEGKDCKAQVNYEKTVDDLAKLAGLMKAKYPGVPLYLMGESLGATVCLAVAAKVPQYVDGLVLSGTAVMKNSLMFDEPGTVLATSESLFDPKHRVNIRTFIDKLVSDEPGIAQEMENDPLIPKKLRLGELLQTARFTGKTISYAKRVAPNTPVLILQGGKDKCVVPSAAIKLAANLRTSDQSMRWLYAHGHLLLETSYVSPEALDAMTIWFTAHTADHEKELQGMREDLYSLGGKRNDICKAVR
jgi:acylglycerol lipase